jgi:hypothetical protein
MRFLDRFRDTTSSGPVHDQADPLNRLNGMACDRSIGTREYAKEYERVENELYGGDHEALERALADRSEAHSIGEAARDIQHGELGREQAAIPAEDYQHSRDDVEETLRTGRVPSSPSEPAKRGPEHTGDWKAEADSRDAAKKRFDGCSAEDRAAVRSSLADPAQPGQADDARIDDTLTPRQVDALTASYGHCVTEPEHDREAER